MRTKSRTGWHSFLKVYYQSTTFKVAETSGSSTVYSYACEALTLGLFMMDFKDAVREGDGVLSLWKYMFLFCSRQVIGRTMQLKHC
jgi:hypothetical protein